MAKIVRTVYGAELQSAQLSGLPIVIRANTTLNQKFNISAGVALASDDVPRVRYVGIGNRGHILRTSGGGSTAPVSMQHQPTEAGMWGQIPFVLRPISDDIDATARLRYGLRRVETHGGDDYFAYYLRRLDFTDIETQLFRKSYELGNVTTEPFVPSLADLSPEQPEIDSEGVNVSSGEFVAAYAQVNFELDEDDILEGLNVANVLYGSDDFAIISEIAFCSGVDKTVSVPDGLGGSINFLEVIAAQIFAHVPGFHALKFSNTGLTKTYDLGAMEPLFLEAP